MKLYHLYSALSNGLANWRAPKSGLCSQKALRMPRSGSTNFPTSISTPSPMASRCCFRDAGDGLDSERMMSTMNRTYSSFQLRQLIQDKVKELPFSPAESIRTIFSKTAFPLIELWKISFRPLFIGVGRFSGSKNLGMSRAIPSGMSILHNLRI